MCGKIDIKNLKNKQDVATLELHWEYLYICICLRLGMGIGMGIRMGHHERRPVEGDTCAQRG